MLKQRACRGLPGRARAWTCLQDSASLCKCLRGLHNPGCRRPSFLNSVCGSPQWTLTLDAGSCPHWIDSAFSLFPKIPSHIPSSLDSPRVRKALALFLHRPVFSALPLSLSPSSFPSLVLMLACCP